MTNRRPEESSKELFVSVCIPTRDRAHLLRGAVESVAAQELPPHVATEVIVVDDGSVDETPDVVSEFIERGINIIYERLTGVGPAEARNTAARLATGDWFAFLDDDEVASTTWISELCHTAIAKQADCVGGPVLLRLPDNSDVRPTRTVRSLLGENPLMREPPSRFKRLDPRLSSNIPGGGNALVNRGMFEALGGFDDRRPHGEDFDFFTRARVKAFRLRSAPRAIAYHMIPEERLVPRYLFEVAKQAGRTQAQLHAEYASTPRVLLVILAYAIRIPLVILPKLISARLRDRQDEAIGALCSLHVALRFIATSIGAGESE